MAEHSNKTHVLLFPFPGQGHVPPMLSLAELLSGAGLLVTFLNTEHVHRRLSAAAPDALDRFRRTPTFRFRTIPDGLPEDDPRTAGRMKDLVFAMMRSARTRELYRGMLASGGDEWPPVTCVVADGFLPMGLEVAEEVGVPAMILRTSSACSVWAYCNVGELMERGEVPFDDGTHDDTTKEKKGMTTTMSTDHHMNMTMAPPPSSMHMRKMMMHMTFFWGRRVDILFSGWPGDRGIAAYLLALLLVFVLAFLVELLSFLPLRGHHRRLSSAVMMTGVTVLRTGFSYLVMLSVMSFNVGVLLVAVAGHAIGFFVFGSGLFFRRWPKEEENGGGPKC